MKYKELTFSERKKIIDYLFELARKKEFQRNYLYVSENTRTKEERSLIEILDNALEFLTEESRRIMVNDFKVKTNKSWWQYFYSRTTYYRLKDKATREFLNYLHTN